MDHRESVIVRNWDPRDWKSHRYGLPLERWERLQGRNYWITGAGTGFGRAMTVALASAGARVFLTGRREFKLRETIAEIGSLDVSTERCHSIPADIDEANEIETACTHIRSLCSTLHGLVNNAAAPQRTQ